ncbi:hypothetical protein FG386_003429 [Cryptosporidium ryanae]|uniref:uncharacterized protein n=1 Tax=Cryptosporidium ryanae TaxID=515981 RepID=UPI00351A9FCD|nr:hypothetical protein FG386_003429 [Cryptosporidium ryanae]
MKLISFAFSVCLYLIGITNLGYCQEFRYLESVEAEKNLTPTEVVGNNKTKDGGGFRFFSNFMEGINKKVEKEKNEFSSLFIDMISSVGSELIEFANKTRIIG